jgi:hypothetical protein
MKMRLLGLELSDAGIMLAGSQPVRLLALDETDQESPGYALPEKKHLIVGKAAQKKAHLQPRLVTSHFWDQLNTEPLDHPRLYTHQNHAEIACAHLARIWQNVKRPDFEVVIAVPGFYHQDHLGLLLGIANELSMPVKGFIPIALAAAGTADHQATPLHLDARKPDQQATLLHLDIHLHRTEIIVLSQDEHLTFEKSVTVEEKGLADLHRAWVEAIAAEFVRTTRFDPLHLANSEQELFDRLPAVLEQIGSHPSIAFEMTGGSSIYRVTLSRELFTRQSKALFSDIQRHIANLGGAAKTRIQKPILQLSHRIAHLPGLQESLAAGGHDSCHKLEPGAAALGAVRHWDHIARQDPGQKISFFTSYPLARAGAAGTTATVETPGAVRTPSHLLFHHIAYPLCETPLLIGTNIEPGQPGIQVKNQISGVSRIHCSVELRGTQVVLKDFSTYGTFVDDVRINGSTTLRLGQTIRVGTPGEQLHLIACLDQDET